MRLFLSAAAVALLLPGCTSVPRPAEPAPASPAITKAEPPAAPAEPARFTRREISGILFEGVAFDSRHHRLVVVDQPGGPGSEFPDAAAAGRSRGGVAAVNAGFFTPEGAPLGLVVSAGKAAGSWNSASSLGSGVWHDDGSPGIVRRERMSRPAAAELVQAGPMLVESGKAVGGLEVHKVAARVVVLTDGGTRWWIGRSSPCTLAALAEALANSGPAGWQVRQALNLDGGRSADLWVSAALPGGPATRRPAWHRPVRNFLVLVPRA